MDVRDRRRVPIAGVVVGGFLLGAGVIGLYRVADAQPLPPPDLPALPPPGGSALLPPAMPTPPALPPIEQAAGNVPPVAPPAVPPATRAGELRPQPALPEPAPLPTPAAPPAPVKPPVDSVPLPAPSLDPLPSPVPPPSAAKPDLPPVLPSEAPASDSIPKPVDPPAAGALPPADTKPVAPPPAQPAEQLPPAKPESNLRPELPSPNVTQNDPAGRSVLPPPDAVVPPRSSPAPGAALMTLTPHKTLLTAAAGMALAFTPIASLAADDPKPAAADAKTVEALDRKVKDLTDDIKKVREEKDRLELLVNGSKDGLGKPGLLKRLEQAEADLKAMNEKMKALEEKLTTKSTSEKTTLPSAMVGKGKVVLVNEFRTKLSVMVNGTSYPLDPSQTKDLLVPFGDFTYELVEFPNAAPVKSNIKEGETVTLRIK